MEDLVWLWVTMEEWPEEAGRSSAWEELFNKLKAYRTTATKYTTGDMLLLEFELLKGHQKRLGFPVNIKIFHQSDEQHEEY